jgi:hypothetical protein
MLAPLNPRQEAFAQGYVREKSGAAAVAEVKVERPRRGESADERGFDKVVRLLPKIADAYRRRVRALLAGTLEPHKITATRAALMELFGGPV